MAFNFTFADNQRLGLQIVGAKSTGTSQQPLGFKRVVVDNDNNGLIVDNSDEGLYDGLKYLINNRDVLDRYKTNLKDYDYDNDSIVKKLNGLFKQEDL